MECKLDCPYQQFTFLSKYDTICPFIYNQKECFEKTKYNIKEIMKYDDIFENARNNNRNGKNNKKNG